jgi:hypothetical protein
LLSNGLDSDVKSGGHHTGSAVVGRPQPSRFLERMDIPLAGYPDKEIIIYTEMK